MKKQTPYQIAATKIFNDLQAQYLEKLEEEGMKYSHYEDREQGYSELVYEDWVLENLEDVLEMVAFLGFDTFQEWFMDYASSNKDTDLSRLWSKELSATFEEIIGELQNG